MNQTAIRVTTFKDFKKTVEIQLGHPLTKSDVAVIGADGKPFEQKVAAIDLSSLMSKMIKHNRENHIVSDDVAVITNDQLIQEEKNTNSNDSIKPRNKLGK